MTSSCLDSTEDNMNNDEEISQLSAEIDLLNIELNKKCDMLKKKQVLQLKRIHQNSNWKFRTLSSLVFEFHYIINYNV